MKKIFYIFIITLSIYSFVLKTQTLMAATVCQEGSIIAPDGVSCIKKDASYHYLAPLPCEEGTPGCENGQLKTFDPTGESKIGGYLNVMIRIFIGICAVLAVIMIVIGGLEYMTSELVSNKEHGKERISGAIFGLILALGAWTILNQINPSLLNTELKSLETVNVEVTLDDANFAKTEKTISSTGTGYKLSGGQTAGINDFVSKGGCASLEKITVNTASKKANFCAGTNCVSIPINTGYQGVAEIGQGKSGDGKTPKGTYTISGDRRIASGNNAVTDGKGIYNLGIAFINIGVGNRGIGFHGSAENTLGTTNGCIRMTNDDLKQLAPCMKTGTTVVIQ